MVLITFQVTIYVLSISLPIVTFLPYKQKNVMRPEIFFVLPQFLAQICLSEGIYDRLCRTTRLGVFLMITQSTTDLFLLCCHAQILCGSSGAYLVLTGKKPWFSILIFMI